MLASSWQYLPNHKLCRSCSQLYTMANRSAPHFARNCKREDEPKIADQIIYVVSLPQLLIFSWSQKKRHSDSSFTYWMSSAQMCRCVAIPYYKFVLYWWSERCKSVWCLSGLVLSIVLYILIQFLRVLLEIQWNSHENLRKIDFMNELIFL